jgi:hypothetical protein
MVERGNRQIQIPRPWFNETENPSRLHDQGSTVQNGSREGVRAIKSEPPNYDPTAVASSSLHLIVIAHCKIYGPGAVFLLRPRRRSPASETCAADERRPSRPRTWPGALFATRNGEDNELPKRVHTGARSASRAVHRRCCATVSLLLQRW